MNFYYIPSMQPGKYRHYKWGEYEVIGIAHHTETREDMVVYRPLYEVTDLGEDFARDPLFVRPKDIFCEKITHEGKLMDRFRFLG